MTGLHGGSVVIVGGGVVGSALTFQLTRHGYRDVTVVERGRVGEGATGYATGGIRQQFTVAVNARLARRSVDFFGAFEEHTGSPLDFRQHGYLFLVTDPAQLATLTGAVAVQNRHGIPSRIVNPDQVAALFPQVRTGDLACGSYCPTDGPASPTQATSGLLTAARERGATVYRHRAVTGLRRDRDGWITGVDTEAGPPPAEAVVLAPGRRPPRSAPAGRPLPAPPVRAPAGRRCPQAAPAPRSPGPEFAAGWGSREPEPPTVELLAQAAHQGGARGPSDHRHPPRLSVAGGRCLSGRGQHVLEQLPRDRPVEVGTPAMPRGDQCLELLPAVRHASMTHLYGGYAMALPTAPAPGNAGLGGDDSVVQRTAKLTEQFARRADDYDRTSAFPAADFDDLFAAGLNAPTVPFEYGGLGLGPFRLRAHPLWMMTVELAKADLSLARCWEGHANGLMLIDALGNDTQRAQWFEGVVDRGEKWVVWSGEPQAPKPGEVRRFGTTLTRTEDGWVIDGKKAFATSATGADWAILMVNPAGPGGARQDGSEYGLLMLACQLTHPSITVDTSWWNPIGMRATASHVVTFDHTLIPDSWSIGEPGAFLKGGWNAALLPHYAASFLGAAEGAYDYALEYLRRQAKGEDPYVQQRAGKMALDIRTGHLWLSHVAALWDSDQREPAQIAGGQARQLIEHLALATVDNTIRSCGARCLIRPSPVERILRDLTLYVRHDNSDRLLATIGRIALGLGHDASFLEGVK